MVGPEPIVYIDEGDITKPLGKNFEKLCVVRDGSAPKNTYKNGYWVTEFCALDKRHQPVSVYSKIYSTLEDDFKSQNAGTIKGLDVTSKFLKNPTYVMDRGFDGSKIYEAFDSRGLNYVIRGTGVRYYIYNGESLVLSKLPQKLKNRTKATLKLKTGNKEVSIFYGQIRLRCCSIPKNVVVVTGIGKKPMALITNTPVTNNNEARKIVQIYMSRWRIEEYFRCKKQTFKFEDFENVHRFV